MESTQELEHQIRESGTPDLLKRDAFSAPSLTAYLAELLRDHNLPVPDILLHRNLDRSHAYHTPHRTRTPTRNFLLRLAFLLQLSPAEAQRLLKIAGRPSMYARNRRDAAVLYGLSHKLSLEETESLLQSLREEGLA